MKVIIVRSHLREVLLRVARASGDNEKLPILKNVLIEAQDNLVILTATNLEIAITSSLSGKVIEAGKITVPMGVFQHIIGSMQGERINLESKGNNFEITGDNYHASLKGTGADEFPIIPKVESGKQEIEFKNGALIEAIQAVLSATQTSDVRPELNSILLDFQIDSIKIAGTDGFRLAEKTIGSQHFSSTHEEKFKILIPLKTAMELTHVLGDDDPVRLAHDEHQVLVTTDKTKCISRLVQGNFPEYQALIPKKFIAEITVDKEELLNALKLVSGLSDRTYEVVIRCTENKKAIELHSRDQALGDNTYVLGAKITGEINEVAFNWRYLSDAIKSFSPGEVYLGISENDHPALIKPKKDDSYFYIAKPIVR